MAFVRARPGASGQFPEIPRTGTSAPDTALLAALAIGATALTLYVTSPLRERFFVAPLSILSFALAPLVSQRVRARVDTPISPVNWALLVFLFQLVINPLLLCYSGPFANTLPLLPGDDAINAAILVSVVAWVAFVAGCELAEIGRASCRKVG